jgi:Domain of unknown function (DUF4167)
MNNNRQPNNRRRGRTNNNGRPQGNNNNRSGVDYQNQIDNRARGNASQMLEKYRKLAGDAQMNGDRVNGEYYLQFADHYFRVLADFRSRQELRNEERNRNQPSYRDDEPREESYLDQEPNELTVNEGDDEQSNASEYENRPQRDDRPQRDMRPRRNDRPERNDRYDRNERPETSERTERSERIERDDRPQRNDRAERPARNDRPERSEPRTPRPNNRTQPRRHHSEDSPDDANEGGIDLAVLPPSIAIIAEDDDSAAKPMRKPRARRVKPSDDTVATEAAE